MDYYRCRRDVQDGRPGRVMREGGEGRGRGRMAARTLFETLKNRLGELAVLAGAKRQLCGVGQGGAFVFQN